MGLLPVLVAWLLAAIVLGAEALPNGWLRAAPAFAPALAPGGRTALVLLFFACAAAVPSGPRRRSDRPGSRPVPRACLVLALASGPLAAALALDWSSILDRSLALQAVATGLATTALGAAAGARVASLSAVLFLGLGLAAPLLAGWGGAAGLEPLARLSPYAWLARSAGGPQALDGWLAPYGAALLALCLVGGGGPPAEAAEATR